jgi:hypothetical protein
MKAKVTTNYNVILKIQGVTKIIQNMYEQMLKWHSWSFLHEFSPSNY